MSDNNREVSEKGRVFIKMTPFKDMFTHVLRFANVVLEYNEQVLGFCIGKKNPNSEDITITRVIPITHGDEVELGFSEKIHNSLIQIQEEASNENLSVVGWYHSHPEAETLFFSDVDKKNHLYIQNKNFQYGFGIVFDHSKMKKSNNFGLEIFRLKDLSKGDKSDYIKVKFEIEKPNSLDFYKWVQKFVEYGQTKNPIIIEERLELREQVPRDLQEIPISAEQLEMEIDLEYQDINPVVDGFKKGLQNFSNLVLNDYKSELETWSSEFNDGALKGLNKISDSLAYMNSTIDSGFERVEKWIETKFKERIDEYKEKVEGYVNKRLSGQEDLKVSTNEIKEILTSEIKKHLEQSIDYITKSIKKDINEIINKLYEISMIDAKIKERIENSTNEISSLTEQIQNLSIDMLKGISAINHPFETNLSTNYDKLISELEPFNDNFDEFETFIERLQKIIPDFRNIKK